MKKYNFAVELIIYVAQLSVVLELAQGNTTAQRKFQTKMEYFQLLVMIHMN